MVKGSVLRSVIKVYNNSCNKVGNGNKVRPVTVTVTGLESGFRSATVTVTKSG